MTHLQRRVCESNIYHVVNRGVGKQIIFESEEDKRSFYNMLMRACGNYPVRVYAWCLMDNHVHLLLKGEMDQISAFMRNVLSTYAIGFNKRYDRSGHLFEGRFQSEPIESDAHFLAAVRYIHQNPQKAGLAPVENYRWSSYGEYVNQAPPIGRTILAETEFTLNLFGSLHEFVLFHGVAAPDCFLEPEDSKTTAGNKRALRIAIDELGEKGLFNVKSLPKDERNEAISRLKGRGLTLRQIERCTGISRSQIARID